MTSVIIYTYFESPSSNYNLSFFVKKEIKARKNIDYIIVINGFTYLDNIQLPDLPNLHIIKRENIGFDFGGHKAALDYLDLINKQYNYYFFLNSGVIGPILPDYFTQYHWSNIFTKKINKIVKCVGTTIVCLPHEDEGGYGPKVEGFFFIVDQIGLDLLKNEKTIFFNHSTFKDDIINGEYGVSNCILKNGFSIDCMLRAYKGVDWRDSHNYNLNGNLHPSRENSYFGGTINPYDVIFHKWFWHNNNTVHFNLIEQYVNNI